jgi:formylglycine-generating enzyme required for sulfatase activity
MEATGAFGGSAGNSASGGASSPCSGSAEEGGAGAASNATPRPPSCEGLADTCGPCEAENCCESLPVPGGTFLRSYDGDVYKEETWSATVSDFRLDRFEVTVGRFRPFVDAIVAGWRPPAGAGKHTHLNGGLGISRELGWSTDWNDHLPKTKERWSDDTHLACDVELSAWTAEPGSRENHAINCVSWIAAYAFCIWDEGFLPTEAEWNYAAAGGSEQREYPWGGSDPSANLAVYYCRSGGTPGCAWPVGSRPAGDGRFGQADLAGNNWEWVLDSANVLSVSWSTCASGTPCTQYPTAACDNCGYFEETFNRVKRGGSNTDAPKNVRTALRARSGFLDFENDVGLRCARVP